MNQQYIGELDSGGEGCVGAERPVWEWRVLSGSGEGYLSGECLGVDMVISRLVPDLGTQIWPEPDADLGRACFGNLYQRTICLMKLKASTMLSAAI